VSWTCGRFHVHYSEEDNLYVGLCDGYPILSWWTSTPAGALEGIRMLVDEHERQP